MTKIYPILHRSAAALTVFAAVLAAPGFAQELPVIPPEQPRAEATLPSGIVPDILLGNRCTSDMPTGPTIQLFRLCMPRDLMRQPAVVFAIERVEAPLDAAGLRNYMAEPFHERRIFQERLREFTVPSRPGATGLFGIFQLDMGNRYVWALQDGAQIIRVMVFSMAEIDTDHVGRTIETSIYGNVAYGAQYRGGTNR